MASSIVSLHNTHANPLLLDQKSQPKRSKKKKEVAGAIVTNGRHDFFSSILFSSVRWPLNWRNVHDSEVFTGTLRYRKILNTLLTTLLLGSRRVCNSPTQSRSCPSILSAADFFKDAPWLNVPKDRCGEILIEPLYPPGKLLGGSPLQGGKVSKLAALAAARKKKDEEKNQDAPSQTSTTSVALLDKLSRKGSTKKPLGQVVQPDLKLPVSENGSMAQLPQSQPQFYPSRNRKNSSILFQGEKDTLDSHLLPTPGAGSFGLKPARVAPIAAPSSFARAMFGMSNSVQEHLPKRMKMMFTLPQVPVSYAEKNPFAEPSPDDIVRNAQNSKGLASDVES